MASSARTKRSLFGLITAVVAAVAIWWATGDTGGGDTATTTGPPPVVTSPDATDSTTPPASSSAPRTTASVSVTTDATASSAPATSAVDTDVVDTGAVGTAPEGTDPDSGLAWIALDELPPEAHDTLELIDSGGPFPFDRDGVTFENREGILPNHEGGYYREYTVETPGSDDRGARRIVTGEGGEMFYTDDHYDSFERIAQ